MNKKVLFILMPKQFQDLEFNVPYQALLRKGFDVDVAGIKPGEAHGCLGMKFTPNKNLASMRNGDFDAYSALVIPGGPGSTRFLWKNKTVQHVAQFFNHNKKIVATICNACAVPAEAGLLKNKQATIYPSDEGKALLTQHHVTFVDQGCVVLPNEKIITAQSPEYAQEFAQAIITLLENPRINSYAAQASH